MEDGITPVERTLLDHDDAELVRQVVHSLQSEMTDTFVATVRRLSRREVLGYESQTLFDPDDTVEIFVLGAAVEAG